MRRSWRDDSGTSLLEIVIACVILGLLGLTLVNGLATVHLDARTKYTPSVEFGNLTAAQTIVERAPFTPCTTNATPYASLNASLASLNVRISQVSGLSSSSSLDWGTCGSTWLSSDAPTILQEVTLVSTMSNGTSRVLLKASPGYAAKTSSGNVFTVASTSTNTVNVAMGCSPTCKETLRLTVPNSATGQVISSPSFYIVSTSAANFNPTIDASTGVLTVPATSGTPYVLVGAYDTTTGAQATPMKVFAINLSRPTFSVTYPTGQSAFTAIEGFGFYGTQNLTVSGTAPTGYSPVFSDSDPVFNVSSNGAISLASPTTLTSGSKTVTVSVNCCGFTDPNAVTTGTFSVSVTPKIAKSSQTLSTSCAHFLSTTSTSPCTITSIFSGGSGALTPTPAAPTSTLYGVASQTYAYSSGYYTLVTKVYLTASKTSDPSSICYPVTSKGKTTYNNTSIPAVVATDPGTSQTAAADSAVVTCVN